MKVTLVSNGSMSIILSPENDIEKAFIKELSGGETKLIASGNSILSHSVEGGLLITKSKGENSKDVDKS